MDRARRSEEDRSAQELCVGAVRCRGSATCPARAMELEEGRQQVELPLTDQVGKQLDPRLELTVEHHHPRAPPWPHERVHTSGSPNQPRGFHPN